ncbi:MAG: HAMP domain-containing histidine kinase [Bacteroides sp.]|nr:HAMP domain-containing histidine kinase [Bacteroides sp.]MCM1095311.1 HAMP domain-containing histidine kinase [Terasakiella sp.]
MSRTHITRLHWKLFFPLVGLLWLVIGITIPYFVTHERQRLSHNLGNRLSNVNNTVIDAYAQGADLQKTVDFIKLFTNQTTLDPLRLTVYDSSGKVIADNREPTIVVFDSAGRILPAFADAWDRRDKAYLHDMTLDGKKFMVSSATGRDGSIHTFAALPYEGEVGEFLSIDSMVWVVVVALGLLAFVLAYFSSRAICRNVYALRDFAEMISSNNLPDDIESWRFSKDELGEVSKRLLLLYREKIRAEHEKILHERQIGINVSHELNTPVAIIKGYLDTILMDNDIPEEQRRLFLTRARDNTDRLAELIDDLNTVMRLQENKTPVSRRAIDFRDLAARVADDVRHNHMAGDMTLDIDIPAGCIVTGNETLLTGALLNLVKNAAMHSHGSRISIRLVGRDSGRLIFSFSDDGTGVDDEHLDRLFDLFYRVDGGRARKNGGAGLGLPMVKRIFMALDGDIAAGRAPSGGLELIFSLPEAPRG